MVQGRKQEALLQGTPDRSAKSGPRAPLWVPLVALLLAFEALQPLQMAASGTASSAARAFGIDRPEAVPVISAAGCLCAGWLADRWGVRRLVGAGLAAWSAAATLGSVASGPAAALSVHWSLKATIASLSVGALVAVATAVPRRWRALALAAVILAGRVWDRGAGAYDLAVWKAEGRDMDAAGQLYFLLAGTAGALATAVWLGLVRGGDRERGAAASLAAVRGGGLRAMGCLVLVVLCGTIVSRAAEHGLPSFAAPRLAATAVPFGSLSTWLNVVSSVALLGASACFGALRPAARRPLLVGGCLLAGLTITVPAIRDPQSLLAVATGVGVGLGVAALALAALVEVAPEPATGRVIGLTLAIGTVVPPFASRLISTAPPATAGGLALISAGLVAAVGAGAAAAAFAGSAPVVGPGPAPGETPRP